MGICRCSESGNPEMVDKIRGDGCEYTEGLISEWVAMEKMRKNSKEVLDWLWTAFSIVLDFYRTLSWLEVIVVEAEAVQPVTSESIIHLCKSTVVACYGCLARL